MPAKKTAKTDEAAAAKKVKDVDVETTEEEETGTGLDAAKKVLATMNKTYGNPFIDVGRGDVVSTGIQGTDMILHGGLNFGSIHEFYGLSKTGKSLMLQLTAVQVQRAYKDAYVVILDRENAYDPKRTLSIGLDPQRTILIPSRYMPTVPAAYDVIVNTLYKIEAAHGGGEGRDAAGMGRNFRKTKSPHVVFLVDSMPAFAESDGYVEDQGRRAKAWHAVFRRLTSVLDPYLMILVSNHITYSPGSYGTGETKTTGVAIDYYRDCGVKLTKICDMLDSKGRTVGIWMGAETDKTRRGAMHAKTFFPVYFRQTPVHYTSGVLPYALYLGLAEMANPSAWKKDKGKKEIWPNFNIAGKSINERDPEKLAAFIEEYGILEKIAEKEKEVYG